MDINLRPRKVVWFLIILAAGLTLAHITGQFAEIILGRNYGLSLFDFDQSQSVPRFFSAVMLLLCSTLFLTIGIVKKKENTHNLLYWIGLALVFLFLAITKSTALHEELAAQIRLVLNISKIQFYAWAYGIVVVVFPVVYLKFFLGLPKKTMLLFAIGAFTFVVGAFGFDLVVAYLGRTHDHHSVEYIGFSTIEGIIEMGGIIIIVYTVLEFIGSELKWIRVRIVE